MGSTCVTKFNSSKEDIIFPVHVEYLEWLDLGFVFFEVLVVRVPVLLSFFFDVVLKLSVDIFRACVCFSWPSIVKCTFCCLVS